MSETLPVIPSQPDPRRRLWASADPAVDAALRGALSTCRPEERPELVRVMLDRGDLAGLVAVIESQDQAEADERAAVLGAAEAGILDGALRTLLSRAGGSGSSNEHALRLVREAKLGRLAYLLTELIRRGRDGLAEDAAALLVELCEVDDPASRESVRSAVDTAVARFDRHRHAGVLEAYLQLLPARMPAAQGVLQTPTHPAADTLGRRLAAATTEVDRRALLPLCVCDGLHGAIRAGLLACRDAETLSDALQHGALLVEPGVGRMLAGIPGEAAATIGNAESVSRMHPWSRRWMPMLWRKLALEPGVLLERLDWVAQDDDAATRLAALRVASAVQPADETQTAWADLLVRFSHDAEAGIARAAAAALDRAASPATIQPSPFRPVSASAEPRVPLATVSRLATSPHDAVRATAGRRIGPGAFTRVWDHWLNLEPGRRAATLFALRKLDPGFDQRLLRRLHEADRRRDPHRADPRLRALSWVRALGCPAGPLSDAALGMTGDADPRIAASAVMAAAMAPQPGATDLLHRLTRHADARVRANAVEALDQRLDPQRDGPAATWPPHRLEQLIADDAPRVRANALLALFRRNGQTALRPIAEMLRDTRPPHRRSALWLAGVTGLIDATQNAEALNQAAVPSPDTATRPASNPAEVFPAIDPTAFDDDATTPPGVSELLQALDDAINDGREAAA
ncbi:MAG: HEAT repeat domain-containing protein [Planctomycetota bacterium]